MELETVESGCGLLFALLFLARLGYRYKSSKWLFLHAFSSEVAIISLDSLSLPLSEYFIVTIHISGNYSVCHIADTNSTSGRFIVSDIRSAI